jgi:ribosomal protein S21
MSRKHKNMCNVEVTLDEVKGNASRLIKKFMKKVKKERIVEDYLEETYYTKPSDRKRRERLRGQENARKANREKHKLINSRR